MRIIIDFRDRKDSYIAWDVEAISSNEIKNQYDKKNIVKVPEERFRKKRKDLKPIKSQKQDGNRYRISV